MNKDIKYPSDGLVGIKVRVLNKPMMVTVDDFIPVITSKISGDLPIFARGSRDQDYWVSLAEKAFAKLYGNYGQLIAGDTQEVWRMFTGAPTGVFKVKDYANKTVELF